MAAQTLDPAKRAEIQRRLAAGQPKAQVARELNIDRNTVAKYAAPAVTPEFHRAADIEFAPAPGPRPHVDAPFLPDPAPEAGGPALPDPLPLTHDPYKVDEPGDCLVFGDQHMPCHDRRSIELAVAEARRRAVKVVLVNGDLLDGYQLSRHPKEQRRDRFADAVTMGRQFFAWLRSRFPRARIVFKLGNHDEYLKRYLNDNAPAVADLEGFDLPSVLKCADYGVEAVGDKRAVHLGRLPVFHGHEFRGSGGVNPARWLYLRIGTSGMTNHFHRSSSHNEASYDGRLHATWSLGCTCWLYPDYDPNNKWDHGWGFVTVGQDGFFEVQTRRLLRDGRVV